MLKLFDSEDITFNSIVFMSKMNFSFNLVSEMRFALIKQQYMYTVCCTPLHPTTFGHCLVRRSSGIPTFTTI